MLLTIIGVDVSELRSVVMTAHCDGDIAQWLRSHADTSQYTRANTVLSEFRHEAIAPEHLAHFESLYPEFLRSRYPVSFDLLEADDRELYPSLGKE